MKWFISLLAVSLLLVSCDNNDQANRLEVYSPVSDHMVIQQGKKLILKGKANPNTNVKASMHWKNSWIKSDIEGRWQLVLGPWDHGGPYTLKIISAGKIIEITDVLIGEVWLAAGQSNMCWPVKYTNNPNDKISRADKFGEIRFYQNLSSRQKNTNTASENKWETVNNKTIGNFSAVAYVFATEIYKKKKIPIGIIQACEDNVSISSLMNEEDLAQIPEYKERISKKDLAVEYWSVAEFQASQEILGNDAVIRIGNQESKMATWLNENRLVVTNSANEFQVLKPMITYNNKIFVQVRSRDCNQECIKSFHESLARSQLQSTTGEIIPISQWQNFEMYEKDFPGNLYNFKIKPIIGYPIKGVLWYQGESDVSRYDKYGELFTLLVKDWHKLWNDPELPFVSVQLHDFDYKPHGDLEKFWQVQEDLSKSIPHHYMVSAKDLSDKELSIHPRDKDEIGVRLANTVLDLK